MYTEKVMDHFMNPRNVGEIADADGVGEVGNVKCGDIMRIYIKVVDERIEDIKFKTFGCGSAIAASSVATEIIMGLTIEEALKVTNKQVVEALDGLPPVKVHCSVLAEQALKAAIYDYASKTGKTYAGLEGFDPNDDHDHHDVVEIEF
jgi:nitrogen fixation NifU-like protein